MQLILVIMKRFLVSPEFHYDWSGLYIYFWDRYHQ